ncbi:MAG: hypothetical protein HY471_00780 [Candidatus Sungbacteria bacterium]|nr:hypothetical protein [Candidatus Sungbacteria bacterium]
MTEDLQTTVQAEIETFLRCVNTAGVVDLDESTHLGLRFNIKVPDARFLIGERGANLASLEHLVKKVVQKKHPEAPHFLLDVNDYKLKRTDVLRDEVKAIAKKVRMYRKEIALKPMTSFERRVIHMTLALYPDITTESLGEGPDRRVIIKPYP